MNKSLKLLILVSLCSYVQAQNINQTKTVIMDNVFYSTDEASGDKGGNGGEPFSASNPVKNDSLTEQQLLNYAERKCQDFILNADDDSDLYMQYQLCVEVQINYLKQKKIQD